MPVSLYIDEEQLLDISSAMMNSHIKYQLNAKPRFKANLPEIKLADCSGFVRYLIYHATNKQIELPSGSSLQYKWCKEKGLEIVKDYNTAALCDGWLRIAFILQRGNIIGSGHVWLVLNGLTIECCGSKNVTRRAWNDEDLNGIKYCFKLAQTFKIEVLPRIEAKFTDSLPEPELMIKR